MGSKSVNHESLSSFVAEPSVPIKQNKYKAEISIASSKLDTESCLKTLQIPESFKHSLVCQAIIAYCYTDTFLATLPSTRSGKYGAYNSFFEFLLWHDEQYKDDQSWNHLINHLSADLPHTVTHQFALYLSEVKSNSANTVIRYRNEVLTTLKWASSVCTFNKGIQYNFHGGEKLRPYTSSRHNPVIRRDDVKRNPALSQLFELDFDTKEQIICPYNDSQLVTNLRLFAVWFLALMRERRKFLRSIKWDDERTIFEILTERLNSGEWSIDDKPVNALWGSRDTNISFEPFIEASAMYAKIYDALLPDDSEKEQLLNDTASSDLTNRLIWLESMIYGCNPDTSLWDDVDNDSFSVEGVIEAIKTKYNHSHHVNDKQHIGIHLSARSNKSIRSIYQPNFSLVDMLLPTASESTVMQWLLASDCIQRSNQLELKLADLQKFKHGKVLKKLNDADLDDHDVQEISMLHHKRRGKGSNASRPGKDHVTQTYYRSDIPFDAYLNWQHDILDAQHLVITRKSMWLPQPTINSMFLALLPISLVCFTHSTTRKSFEAYENRLKNRSSVNGQGAFKWLINRYVDHHSTLRKSVNLARKENTKNKIPKINITIDAIRESRIIFDESTKKGNAEIAKHSGHDESMVDYYRDRSVAKERIQNGLKSNAQVSDLMIKEAISVLQSCNIMSIDEVEKTLHNPHGFTFSDVEDLIASIANDPEHYDVTIFGAFTDKMDKNSGTKIIKDEKSAWMLWCYLKHLECEINNIQANHDEQVVKWIVQHAQWQILFERFPTELQEQAKELAKKFTISYPPIY
ncbi:hypothetical protein [Neptuniibacter sp. QD48_11]|uniref:hypothetical protein n=1 Tax=Neptuniibacter sp. QD48_11 TaxID=3398211 RepID=UPI0039F60FC5